TILFQIPIALLLRRQLLCFSCLRERLDRVFIDSLNDTRWDANRYRVTRYIPSNDRSSADYDVVTNSYTGHNHGAEPKIDVISDAYRLDDVDIWVLLSQHPNATIVCLKVSRTCAY